MNSQYNQNSPIGIAEAVETLSEIIDMDVEHGVGIFETLETTSVEGHKDHRRTYWLNPDDAEKNIEVIKQVFRTVLSYLTRFCRDENLYIDNGQSLEGIKTMMLLVGEAAKKLDKYTELFHLTKIRSVVELKEYRKLQEFYQIRIAHKIDEERLGKWLWGLSKEVLSQEASLELQEVVGQETKHVFIDLESVKKDVDYELFFLRKEDGTRFFGSRLLRNMKLVGDFGDYFRKEKAQDLLFNTDEWMGRYCQAAAQSILNRIDSQKDLFFHEAFKLRDNELVHFMGNCLMALMLCVNPKNSVELEPLKSSTEYFKDFLGFIRLAIHSREYAKLLAYGPEKENKVGRCLLALIHVICEGVYFYSDGYKELSLPISELLEGAHYRQTEEEQTEKVLSNRLSNDYRVFQKMRKGHENGSLVKIIDTLQAGDYNTFDPLMQQSLQSKSFSLEFGEQKIHSTQMGCPVVQEYVNKAVINDEFKEALRNQFNDVPSQSLLLINIQDRTSWKEIARCTALEELATHPEFSESLEVMTLPKDTDFYHQVYPYEKDNKFDLFLARFREDFGDLGSGYYFSPKLQTVLDESFFDGVASALHRVFFSGKNMLLRHHRLDFIELFYLLVSLKAIETVEPDSFCFLCKDGIDLGPASQAMLYCFLKIVNQSEEMTHQEWLQLNSMLHVPALMIRDRLIQQDKFNRFVSALKTVEVVKKEFGDQRFKTVFHEAFTPFFKTSILKAVIGEA